MKQATTIDLKPDSRDRYSVVQQEVDLGSDTLVRGNSDIAITFLQNGRADASLICCRKAIGIYRGPGFQVNLTNSLLAAKQHAELADLTSEITPEQLGRHIFIACAPKSGSTFLKNLLVTLTGY